MSLNDLQLSPDIIARLYPSSLITTDISESATAPIKKVSDDAASTKIKAETTSSAWKSLGNNHQQILIVVNYSELVHLPDEELSFLTSMLSACKLSLDDVVIINHNNFKETGYKNILSHFQSRIVLLFGIDPLVFGLPVGFPQFQVQTVAGCKFLYSASLEVNRTDKLIKSKLWVSLRSIFGI
jgi:hypothetical protein